VSTYSDEAVKGADAMLLTFSKVKGDTFTRATSDILDLAQAMGGDLQGAAIQVGKALQDPEQGMLALRRSGVSFSAAQQQISSKPCSTAGRKLRRRRSSSGAREGVRRRAVGRAQHARRRVEGLGNDFGDLFEGTRDETNGLVGLINQIDSLVKSLNSAREAIKGLLLVLGLAGLGAALGAAATGTIALAGAIHTGLIAAALAGVGPMTALAAATVSLTVALAAAAAVIGIGIVLWNRHVDAMVQAAEQTDAQRTSTEKALATERARNAGLKEAKQHAEDEAIAIAKLTGERQADLGKLVALNQAYGQSDLARQIISIRYDAEAQKAKDAVEHHGKERDALNKLTDAIRDQQIEAAKLAAVKQKDADLAALRAQNDAMVQAAQDASDLADAQIAITLAERSGASAVADAQNAYDHLQVALEANAKITAAQVELKRALVGATDDETAAARQRYDETIKAIGAEKGIKDATIDRIRAANDLKSALGAIDDAMSAAFENGKVAVDKLATSLSRVFDLLSKNKDVAAGLAGLGAGYAVGQQVGGGITGAIGGAAAGAAAGAAFGPVGAIVGGLAGLTGGLLGGAAAAKARREAENQLRDALAQSTAHIKNQIGLISDLDASLADAHQQFADRAKQINDAYAGKKNEAEREALLAQNNTLEAQYIEWLKKQAQATKDATKAAEDLSRAQANQNAEQDSHLRLLNATGQSDAAFAYQQSLELQKDVADGLSGLALSEVIQAQQAEAAQREQEKQTQLLQDQLSTAQQAYDSLKQVYDSLSAFKSSLTIGQYSPLSPRQQLDASRGQLNTLYQAALGGDQAAASQFSGAAQSFLGASQKYNASGAGYVLDYRSTPSRKKSALTAAT
jgi:hypothetical protein